MSGREHDAGESPAAGKAQSGQSARGSTSLQPGDLAWLSAIYEIGSVGISLVDFEGRFLHVNPALCQLLGYTEAELSGRRFSEVTHSDDQQIGLDILGRAAVGDYHTSAFKKRYLRKDGEVVWVLVNPTLLRDAQGNPAGYATVTVDVTEREAAEQALRDSEERYRTYVSNAPDGVFVIDEKGRYVEVNVAACAMTGFDREELLSMTIHDMVVSDRRGRIDGGMEELISTGRMRRETALVCKGGGSVPVVLDAVRLPDGRMMAFCKDITARVQAQQERDALEERVRLSQKLESLGVLAGGIAHDFNNLLVAVLGNAELLAMQTAGGLPADGPLRDIVCAAQRAAELCTQMLAYAGQARVETREISLNDLVQDMGALLGAALSKSAQVHYELAPSLPRIVADGAQVQQIIMNLMMNAAEAQAGDEVQIHVSTSTREYDSGSLPGLCIAERLPEGRYVCLSVRDNGVGMDAHTCQRMFDPFFTTKFTGRGLGLAALHGIVRAHRGAVLVESQPGRGTNVEVVFPVCDSPSDTQGVSSVDAAFRGSGSILLVEDEDMVRTTIQRMLQALGFRVVVAQDGLDALERYRASSKDLRCILLDHEMPKMSGAQALRELRRCGAQQPVIVLSGHGDKTIEQAFEGERVGHFLSKPFCQEALLGALQDVLR